MLILNSGKWVERKLKQVDEVHTIRFRVRPPNRQVLDKLAVLYREAALEMPDEKKDRTPEELQRLIKLTDDVQEILSPESMKEYVTDWDGIGHVDESTGKEVATPFSVDNLMKAFDQYPVLYTLAAEAVQAVVPIQQEEDEKNSGNSSGGTMDLEQDEPAGPSTAKPASVAKH